MYPPRFRYLRAESTEHVLDVLAELGADARVLAGGASLIPQLKYRSVSPSPSVLVDLGWLDDLRGTSRVDGQLRVGAMTRHVEAGADDVLAEVAPGARDAARSIGDPQVRNMGTIGGGLAAVEATGDWGPVLVAAGGSVHAVSRDGERDVLANDLFAGPLLTTLRPDELMTEVRFPVMAGRSGSAHAKLMIRAVTALGSCSIALAIDAADRITWAGVGVGGLTPYPMSVPEAAAVLVGQPMSPELATEAKSALSAALGSHTDVKTSAAHRRGIAGSLFVEALDAAYARAAVAGVAPITEEGAS